MSAAEIRMEAMARNMSAPPRTTLSFSALAPAPPAAGEPISSGAGLRFICRLDARALTRRHRKKVGTVAAGAEADELHQRIRTAAAQVRAEVERAGGATVAAAKPDRATPIEALVDELHDLIARDPLAAAGLPGVGLFLPVRETRAPLPSLLRTLAILSRRRGPLFLRDADPVVWAAIADGPFDLWVPSAAPRSIG